MNYKKLVLLLLPFISLFSCSDTTKPDNPDIKDDNNKDDNKDDTDKVVSFKEAVDNTKNNYSYESIDHQIDNLDATQSHFTYKKLKYNEKQQRMLIVYNTIFTTSNDVFLEYKDKEEYWNQSVYYRNDEDKIICRFKNRGEDSVWDDMSYTSSNQDVFTTQMISYINPDHFTLNQEDNFYYMNNEFLTSEEASRLCGYYGSYQYLLQTYEYVAFSVKDGHLDQYKMAVHFEARTGNSFPYNADNVVTGQFKEVKTTNVVLPDLPIYHEDTLIADEKLVKAQEKTKENYTYKETINVIDSKGNEFSKEFIEQVDNDSFRYYFYSFDAECYTDDYTYTVYKDLFNGKRGASTYETCIYYYEDYTDYASYDMDILDDSVSHIESLGGKYGIKVFEEKEDDNGNYYTPSREKPTKYNPNSYTYLDYACSSFIHGIIGNYVASDGTTYSYQYNDLRFYLDEKGDFYKATYDFNMDYTVKGVTTSYHVIGNGTFSDINSTKIVVPSDPNEELVLDDRLTKLYAAMNTKNYIYKEKYSCYDDLGNEVNYSKEDGNEKTSMFFNEYVDSNKVKQEASCNVIVDYDENDAPIYRFATLYDYYYFGQEKYYNYYAFDDFYENSYYQNGQYNYVGVMNSYKEHLKYFKFTNNKTINGEVVDVFKLPNNYLKLVGKELVISSQNSRYSTVTGLSLFVKDERIIRISYVYDYYDENNEYVGEVEGTINVEFDTCNVEVPNVDVTFLDNNNFETLVEKFIASGYYIDSKVKVNCFSDRTYCDAYFYGKNGISNINCEDQFYFEYGLKGDLYANYNEGEKSHSIKVVPCNAIDFSAFSRDDFFVDSNNNYILDSEKYDEYFKNVFKFDNNVDINPVNFYLTLTNTSITINFQYYLRYKLDDGTYAMYYVAGTLKIS